MDYKPTNDYIFKKIFGHKKNKNLLIDLLSAIIPHINITSLKLEQEVSLEKELEKNKLGKLDIIATLNDNTKIHIEMQVENKQNTIERSLFYASGILHQNLYKNEDYINLPQLISIWILNYNLFTNGPFHEISELKRKHQNIILTNKLEIHYIQLNRFKEKMKKACNNRLTFISNDNLEEINMTENEYEKDKKNKKEAEKKLEDWLTFIIHEDQEKIDKIENEYIQKAEKELKALNADPYERRLAYLREKAIIDEQWAISTALERGEIAGKKEGKKEGKQEGKQEEKIEIAKKMLKEHFDLETIMKITELTKEEIEKLKTNE